MDRSIRFLLNGEPVEITDLPPMTTLLNWLRYDRRLTGTKEGCAEGDCGACTVGLRSVGPHGMETLPVCACIQTLGMLHGKEVITVEGISAPDGRLHPVQQAMAESHGSQCGFCTPGFVMSLWCAHDHGTRPSVDEVNAQLAGNLCRCTGYGPIQTAAQVAHDLPAPDWEETAQQSEARLTALEPGSLDYASDARRFWAPKTLQELAALVETHPDATLLSGATDIGLWVTKHGFDPAEVIFTGHVPEQTAIIRSPMMLSLGAGVTYTRALPYFTEHYPDIGAMMTRLGGTQVRAMGTIGGNIANGSPIGDMAPALIAAGAKMVLRQGSTERLIPVEDFFLAYGQQDLQPREFVAYFRISLLNDPAWLKCYKISKRRDQDITTVLGSFYVSVEDSVVQYSRLAFGGMAGVPARAKAAEAALDGKPWNATTVASALQALTQDFTPMSDHRGSAAYRMQTAQALLWKYYLETTGDAVTRLESVM